jgi:hypothetical protein
VVGTFWSEGGLRKVVGTFSRSGWHLSLAESGWHLLRLLPRWLPPPRFHALMSATTLATPMTRHLVFALSALLATPLLLTTHAAQACSCVPPEPRLLSPSRSVKAPRNARVRVVIPDYTTGKLVLRKHRGGEIDAKRVASPLPNATQFELTPVQPLDADTRYEVALVSPDRHPSTLVFGTFVTGIDSDTNAPTRPKINKTTVNAQRHSDMTSCAVRTPWAEISLSDVRDPERDDAHLLYAVWAPNPRGAIDTNAPPTAYLKQHDGKVKLGRTSYCDPDDFPWPRSGSVTLAIAAVDEAGNRSPLQNVNLFIPALGNRP